MDQDQLRKIFDRIDRTHDPAAGTAKELLLQLIRRGSRGFKFASEKAARHSANVALLLDLEIAAWENHGERKGGIIRLNT